jgi:hypothetical protein
MDPSTSTRRASRTWSVVLAMAGVAFVIAAVRASSAAASANNCGELPGIVIKVTLLLGLVVAGGIVLGGGIFAAVSRSFVVLKAAGVVGAAVVAGLVAGAALTPPNPCGSDQPREVRHAGTLVLTMLEPYAGVRLQGPIECRRPAPGANVREIVTEGGGRSTRVWLLSKDPVTDVDIEVWPFGDSVYRPADKLRVLVNRAPVAGDAGASSFYSDGHGDTLEVRTIDDGSSGSLGFVDLPLWSGERFGTGLPDTISGTVSWACNPEER